MLAVSQHLLEKHETAVVPLWGTAADDAAVDLAVGHRVQEFRRLVGRMGQVCAFGS